MLPNDVFKRPGPHHAFEVDPVKHAQLCAAIAPLEELGDPGPLAALLGRTPDQLRDSWSVSESYSYCLVGEDFGLRRYGPMFERMQLQTVFGERLVPERDARVDPISHVWLELMPYFPQAVAPASEIFVELSLIAPPEAAWGLLLAEMPDDDYPLQEDDEDDAAFERRVDTRAAVHEVEARQLIERWRVESCLEVDAFVANLRVLGDRDALVATWSDDQGWL